MEFRKSVKEELSGNIAKSYVERIAQFHRIQGSTMFHEAAEYIKNTLREIGLDDISIEQFRADGKTKYWTHTSPVGWKVESAELRLTEPEERLICTYEDIPTSLHTFSNATPTEGVTAELIDVGGGTKPEDYEGKEVKGKFVLATGRARLVHEQAVFKRGAAGVITDTITYEMPNVRESLDIPDAHAYQAIWPTAEELDKVTFGFSLSKRQGTQLRALLAKGKGVKLKARVDAKLFTGTLDVVTCSIRGASIPEEEVFLIAHLCHPKPSANDNASGSGLLLEMARTIKTLIDSQKISPPARTIRFLWVPETSGSVAYLSRHEEAPKKMIAGINLDMVGQNQELCHSTLNLDCTPDSLPSYLNDFVFSLMEESTRVFDTQTGFGPSSTFRYRAIPFSGGSDHSEFNDSTIGVPCVMLLQWPDLFYHTSADTPDKVSSDMLKRVGWMATVASLTLANASAEDGFFLAGQTASRGMTRIIEIGRQAAEGLGRKGDDENLKGDTGKLVEELMKTAAYFRKKIGHAVWREKQAMCSVVRMGRDGSLDAFLKRRCAMIENIGNGEIERLNEILNHIVETKGITLPPPKESDEEEKTKEMIPQRLFKGTLDMDILEKTLGEKEYEWYKNIDERDADFARKGIEILNFMDGKRSVSEIVNAVSSEYGQTNLKYVMRFLQDLEKANLVSFK